MKPGGAGENQRYALLRLGLACDADCLFCNVPVESYDAAMKLSTAQALREIDRLAAEGARRLELSGGEPAVRPDLERLVSAAREAGFHRVELQSNGLALAAPGRAARLKEAGLTHAFISLHSHLPKAHDFLVRRGGAFDACVQAVRGLVDAGVETILNPVVTRVQYRWLPDFMSFVGRALPGVESISLSVIQPHGRAWINHSLVPDYRILSPLVERALARAALLGLRVNNPYCGLPLCLGGWSRRLRSCVEWCEAELGRRAVDGMKVRPPVCDACVLSSHCGGVWARYLDIHPEPGLRPVLSAELTR